MTEKSSIPNCDACAKSDCLKGVGWGEKAICKKEISINNGCEKRIFKAVRDSQRLLAAYIFPDSKITQEQVIDGLLGILDDRKLVAEMKQYEILPVRQITPETMANKE